MYHFFKWKYYLIILLIFPHQQNEVMLFSPSQTNNKMNKKGVKNKLSTFRAFKSDT